MTGYPTVAYRAGVELCGAAHRVQAFALGHIYDDPVATFPKPAFDRVDPRVQDVFPHHMHSARAIVFDECDFAVGIPLSDVVFKAIPPDIVPPNAG